MSTNYQTIRLQITVLEVEYLKTRHMNPVLAEVKIEFYHSLPPVEEILGEMPRLERLATRHAKQVSYIAAAQAQKNDQEQIREQQQQEKIQETIAIPTTTAKD